MRTANTRVALPLKALLFLAFGLAIGGTTQILTHYGGPKYLAVLAAFLGVTTLIVNFGVERVFVALILANLTLQLDVRIGMRAEDTYNALSGWPFSLTTISLGVLLLWRIVVGHPLLPSTIRASRLVWRSCGVFVGITMLSILFAQDRILAIFEAAVLLQAALAYAYVGDAIKRVGLRLVLNVLFVGLIFLGSTIVLQALGVPIPGPAGTNATGPYAGRVGGWLGNPNVAAMHLSVVGLIALSGALWRIGMSWTARALGALSMTAIGMSLTVSRGGILALGIGIGAVVIAGVHFKLLRPRAAVAVGITVLIIAIVGGNALLLRVDEGGARGPLMQASWQMIQSAPLTGVGVNNFIVVVTDYWTPQFAGEWMRVVHNQYLLIAAERGVFGLVAFVVFIASVGRAAWRAAATAPKMQATLAVGALGALTARVVHMFVDVFNKPLAWESLMLIATLCVALNDRVPLQAVRSGNAFVSRDPRRRAELTEA